MYDWLGKIENKRYNKDYLTFEEARNYIRNLKLKNWTDWRIYKSNNDFNIKIPKDPSKIYKNTGWENWGDWLGNGETAKNKRVYLPFEIAKKYVFNLKIKTYNDWRNYCSSGNKPENIPANPNKVYKEEWKGMSDFLGKK
jgi:hypothetical protein